MNLAKHLRAVGRAEGKQQGERAVLMRLLERKFSKVPKPYEKYINAADEIRIFERVERCLDAETLNDAFAMQPANER